MVTLYDWDRSPNSFKTKVLLLELGIEFVQRDVDQAELRSAAYRAKFPAGQAPALEDGDLLLSESGAIALHLAETYGGPIPKDARRRALMFRAMFYEAATVAPVLGGRGYFGEVYKPEAQQDARRIAALKVEAQAVAATLSAMLGAHDYFAEELSLADFQLYAATSKAIDHGVFTDTPKNLAAWNERLRARPSIAKAREQYVAYRKAA
jgi:glutathione S-transferase